MSDTIKQIKIGSTVYDVEPAQSATLQVDNAAPTLAWGTTSTVATIDGVDVTVKMPANPNTDTKVTAVGNHYAPTEDTNSKLTANASSTTSATWGSTDMVTGVTLNRDAKGHVTGLSVSSIQMPANPNADTKVTQTVTSSNAAYPLLLAPNGQTATTTTTSYFDSGVTLNPSTNTIAANISGSAGSAAKVANKLTFGSKTFDGSAAATITAADLGLGSALRFKGTTTTALTDGATTNPISINSADYTAITGDVVIVNGTDKELVWTGSAWEELGDAGSHSKVGHTHGVNTSSVAAQGHTHSTSGTAAASSSGTTTVATGSLSSSGGGATVATGSSGSAKAGSETHTHTYTAPTGVSLGPNTTSTDGVQYIEDVSHTAASLTGTKTFVTGVSGGSGYLKAYDAATSGTLKVDNGTRIPVVTSISGSAPSLGGTKTFVTSVTEGSGSLEAYDAASSGTKKVSNGTRVPVITSLSKSGYTPAGSVSLTNGTAPSLNWDTGTNTDTPYISSISGGSAVSKTTKYLHWSAGSHNTSATANQTSTNTGANSGTAITALTGVKVSATATPVVASYDATNTTLILTSTTVATAVAANGTGSCAPSGHTHSYSKTSSITLSGASAPSLTINDTSSGATSAIITAVSGGSAVSATTKYAKFSAGTTPKSSATFTGTKNTTDVVTGGTTYYLAHAHSSAKSGGTGTVSISGGSYTPTTYYLEHNHTAASSSGSGTVGISGGSISKTTKYFHPTITTNTAATTGTPSATTTFVTGVSTSKLVTTTVDKKGHTHSTSGTAAATTATAVNAATSVKASTN